MQKKNTKKKETRRKQEQHGTTKTGGKKRRTVMGRPFILPLPQHLVSADAGSSTRAQIGMRGEVNREKTKKC